MHFRDDVIAFIGPACAFALEPVARLAFYWNTPVITGMGDQVRVSGVTRAHLVSSPAIRRTTARDGDYPGEEEEEEEVDSIQIKRSTYPQ